MNAAPVELVSDTPSRERSSRYPWRDEPSPGREYADLVTSERTYRAPFRVVSDEPADTKTLRRLSPVPLADARAAGGVCLDLRPHLLGTPRVIDGQQETVPESAWLPVVKAVRNAGMPR